MLNVALVVKTGSEGMTSYHYSLFGMLLIASASALAPRERAPAAEIAVPAATIRLLMRSRNCFEPSERRPRREAYRSYFDEYGRKITVDRRGRIVSVEEPQNDQSNEGRIIFPMLRRIRMIRVRFRKIRSASERPIRTAIGTAFRARLWQRRSSALAACRWRIGFAVHRSELC